MLLVVTTGISKRKEACAGPLQLATIILCLPMQKALGRILHRVVNKEDLQNSWMTDHSQLAELVRPA